MTATNQLSVSGQPSAGIMTIFNVCNYGAELQAFALQKFLNQEGIHAELINYRYYKHSRHISTSGSRPLMRLPLSIRVKEFLYPKLQALNFIKSGWSGGKRRQLFEQFHVRNSVMSKEFRSYDELLADPPRYDVYIVGSDQVWNPRTNSSLLPYLLAFAPTGAGRISYASSFGTKMLPEAIKPYFKKYLDTFSAIGVREQSGCDLVRELVPRQAELVLDPTFLLESDTYRKIARQVPDLEPHYLLIYTVSDNPELFLMAEKWNEARGVELPIYVLSLSGKALPKRKQYRRMPLVGVEEFLTLVDRADCIFTDSFHGTAFSIIFQKEFVSYIAAGKENNCRQSDLLRRLGLSGRLATPASAVAPLAPPIEYRDVFAKLDIARKDSISFLLKNIQSCL